MVLPFFGRFLLSLRSVQSCESIYFVSLVADSRLQDSEESFAKTAWGLGRDGVVEPVSIVFNTSLCSSRKCPNPFPPPTSRRALLHYTPTSREPPGKNISVKNAVVLLCERSVYFNTCVNHLGSRLTNISTIETLLLYSASIDVLKFDILTWETRGRKRIEVFEKMRTGSPRLSSCCFFIVRYFSPRLLFPLVRTDREPGTGYSPWEVSWHTMLAIQEP